MDVLSQRQMLDARRNVREVQLLIREAVLQIHAQKIIQVLVDPDSKHVTRRVLHPDCTRNLLITSSYERRKLKLARNTGTGKQRSFPFVVFRWIRSLRQ